MAINLERCEGCPVVKDGQICDILAEIIKNQMNPAVKEVTAKCSVVPWGSVVATDSSAVYRITG